MRSDILGSYENIVAECSEMINYDIFLPHNLAQMDVFWVIAAPSAPGGTACIVSQVVTLCVHFQHK